MTVCAAPGSATTTAPRTAFAFAPDGSYAACLAGTDPRGGGWVPERWTLDGPEPYPVPLPGRAPEDAGSRLLALPDGRVLICRREREDGPGGGAEGGTAARSGGAQGYGPGGAARYGPGGYRFALLYPAGPDTAELGLGSLVCDEVALLPLPVSGRRPAASWHAGPALALALAVRTCGADPAGGSPPDHPAHPEPPHPPGPPIPPVLQTPPNPLDPPDAPTSVSSVSPPCGPDSPDAAPGLHGSGGSGGSDESGGPPAPGTVGDPGGTGGSEGHGGAVPAVTSVWLLSSAAADPGRDPEPELIAEFPGHHCGGIWLDRTGRLLALDETVDGRTRTVVLDLERGGPPTPLLQLAPGSSDRLLLADPDSGLLVVRSDAPGSDRVGWGVLGSRRPFRFPECLRLPDCTVTPFAVQPGAALTPEDCGVALRVDGPGGPRPAVWRPAHGALYELTAPGGWLTGVGHWSADGLRLPYTTGDCPFGVMTVVAAASAAAPPQETTGTSAHRPAPAAPAGPAGPAGPAAPADPVTAVDPAAAPAPADRVGLPLADGGAAGLPEGNPYPGRYRSEGRCPDKRVRLTVPDPPHRTSRLRPHDGHGMHGVRDVRDVQDIRDGYGAAAAPVTAAPPSGPPLRTPVPLQQAPLAAVGA